MLACEYNLRYDDLRLAYYDAQKKGISSLMLMPNHLPVLSAEKETSSDPLHLIAVSAIRPVANLCLLKSQKFKKRFPWVQMKSFWCL